MTWRLGGPRWDQLKMWPLVVALEMARQYRWTTRLEAR